MLISFFRLKTVSEIAFKLSKLHYIDVKKSVHSLIEDV